MSLQPPGRAKVMTSDTPSGICQRRERAMSSVRPDPVRIEEAKVDAAADQANSGGIDRECRAQMIGQELR